MSKDGDEDDLIRRALGGEGRAKNELSRRYMPRVARFVVMMGVKEPDEVVQDSLTEMLRSLASFKGDSRFSSWVFSVALNVCRTWHKANRARNRKRSEESAPDMIDSRNPSRSVLSALVRKENLDRILYAFDLLPPIFREVFVLRNVEGLDFREIAAVTGISEGTARVRVHRARLLLQDELGPAFETVVEKALKDDK